MNAPVRCLTLSLMRDRYVVLRFAADAAVPAWASKGDFTSITRTLDELSIVCAAENVSSAERPDTLWHALKVHGPFKFNEIGVLASLATPLATANIGIFVISTFDTDYLMIQIKDIRKAISALQSAGHNVLQSHFLVNDTKENEA